MYNLEEQLMRGNNELHLCQAAMVEAVQAWLDAITFRSKATVVSVEVDDEKFIVKLTEPQPK